jgi:hypothetical protein
MAALSLATILSLGGTVVGAVGAYTGAQANAASSEYNARVADRDRIVADQNRKAILDQTRIDVQDKRRENKRVMASIRASYGASGVELAGSPLDVLTDTANEQETDTQRVDYEGRIRGREGALQMLGLSESSTLSRMEAKNYKRAGFWGAVGEGLGGAGNVLQRTA